jgi:DNA-binding transcriptional MerR regulator
MGEPAIDERAAEQTPTEIPNRLFFRIGDVAELAGVETYVLRYWETEFPKLRPKKASNGQRQYRRKDVETALEIKRLLYDQGYTIAGARKALKTKVQQKKRAAPKPRVQASLFGDDPASSGIDREELAAIKRELKQILSLLK